MADMNSADTKKAFPSSKSMALDFALKFLKWRSFIAKATIAGTAIACIIAFLIPKEYISFASVRGSVSDFSLSKILESSGAASGLGALANFAMPQSSGQLDYIIAILNSNELQDVMIKRFNLKHRYKTLFIEDTRGALKARTEIRRDVLAEVVYIGIYDENPDTAMVMTNFCVDLLNRSYNQLNSQAALNNRENLEARYKRTFAELTSLEDSLRNFENEYGVYNIQAQTEAAIKSAASLRTEIMLKEIELHVKEGVLGKDAPEIRQMEDELQQLNKSFNELIEGDNSARSNDIFIPFSKTPKIGLDYLRLFRNVEIHTALIKMLVPMLEQARLEEKRETPSLVVIDRATLPEKKSKPQRMIIVLVGFVVSLFFCLAIVLMVEHLRETKEYNPERYSKLLALYSTLKSDLTFWRKKE